MNYSSTVKYESKTCPGVTVTFHRFSVGRRSELELALAEYRQKIGDVYAAMVENQIDWGEIAGPKCETCGHAKEVRPGDPPEVRTSKAIALGKATTEQASIENVHLKPAFLRGYVRSIEGLEIDGAPATVDTLISDGPAELCDELYTAIQERCGLTQEERGNSQSPVTSRGAAGETTSDTTAIPAGQNVST